MKMFSFVALLATSVAFLSCSTNDEGVEINNDPSHARCKIAAKGFEKSFETFDGYKGLDELDPSCKSEEKKFVLINDTNTVNPPDLEKRLYECQEGTTTFEEAYACKDEGMKYRDDWRDEHKKRDLPIPCVALGEAANWWGAWLTDDEIAYLVEIYGVSYDDGNYEYANNDLAIGGNGNPPPPTVGCGK
ncbi:MAG: hypothetical protein LBC75_04405 [Fibromonadaceae bacterium]|jgi:hypothetical protein|nr:hypothetical protein [Fibromonadaceae bacterium]